MIIFILVVPKLYVAFYLIYNENDYIENSIVTVIRSQTLAVLRRKESPREGSAQQIHKNML
jgi:hypothetical protein